MKKQVIIGLCMLLYIFSSIYVSGWNTFPARFHLNLTSNCNDRTGNYTVTADDAPDYSTGVADWESGSTNYCTFNVYQVTKPTTESSTLCAVIKPESIGTAMLIFSDYDDSPSSIGYNARISINGKMQAGSDTGTTAFCDEGTKVFSAGETGKVCFRYDKSADDMFYYVNTTTASGSDTTCDIDNNPDSAKKARVSSYSHATANYFDGLMYDVCMFASSNLEITSIYMNSTLGQGCENIIYGSAPAGDTTPPTIGASSQTPSNVTILNLVTQRMNVSSVITDASGVNLSSVKMNLTLNSGLLYFNKVKQPTNYILDEDKNKSTSFIWSLDEHQILSGTYPLSPEVFEVTTHLNATLTGQNKWIKMKFYNMSNDRQQSFAEIMDQNATAVKSISEYWYCNQNYTTGNPVSSQWCTMFFSGDNNVLFNHTHGKSKHKLLPMGIDTTTGQLNGIYVTKVGYILKRGTVSGDLYFYISNISETGQSQLTTNNGVVYSNIAGTIDSHIHQVKRGENVTYYIKACDTLNNCASNSKVTEVLDFPVLPPSAVRVEVPYQDGTFNGTINITHSKVVSSSGVAISNYSYYYAEGNETDWTYIGINDHPTSSLGWDASGLENGGYRVKVVARDNLGLTSTGYSGDFTLNNPLSLSDTLLTEIRDELVLIDEVLYLIYEVLEMLPIILLYLGLMSFSLWMVFNGKLVSGMIIYVMTIGFDFLFTGYLLDSYMPLADSTFYGTMIRAFVMFVYFWIVAKVISVFFLGKLAKAKYVLR